METSGGSEDFESYESYESYDSYDSYDSYNLIILRLISIMWFIGLKCCGFGGGGDLKEKAVVSRQPIIL